MKKNTQSKDRSDGQKSYIPETNSDNTRDEA